MTIEIQHDPALKLGQTVRFGVDAQRVSLFDPQSGNRL